MTRAAPRLIGADIEVTRVVILLALTFVTGSVDAVSYLGLGRVFTANMTGNVAILGFALTGAAGLPLLRSVAAALGFAAGALMGGRLVRRSDTSLTWPSPITVALSASGALIVAVLVADIGASRLRCPDLMAVLLAIGMGLQGAATRKLAVADLPTTVVTSTLTGLVADSTLAGGHNTRWRRRCGAIIALCAGAAAGALLLQINPTLGLLPATVTIAGVLAMIGFGRMHLPAS